MTSPTFREAATRYVADGGECRFLRPLVAYFGDTPLAGIDQAAIDKAAEILHPKAAASTKIRQVFTPVASVLHDAACDGLCPLISLKRPKICDGAPKWLLPKAARELVNASAPHLAPMLLFMLATGARPAETIYLQWGAVDFDAARVRLPTSDRHVTIPLPRIVVELLGRAVERNGAVFRRQDGLPYARKLNTGGQVKTALNTASRKAGLQRTTLNMLRHTWAIWWLAQHRRNYEGLLEAGRWSDGRLVRHYRTVQDADLDAVCAELDAYFPRWFE